MFNDSEKVGVQAGCAGWRDGDYDAPVERVVPVVPKKPKKRRKRSAMDIAAEACGLVKVRSASGKVYYE